MSAAAARAAIAAIGTDLTALGGPPEDRRAAALLMRLDQVEESGATLGDLAAVPAWLRAPRPAQRRLALRVALLSIAPALAGSIDGHWLGAVAAVAGDDMVDWAMTLADEIEGGDRASLPADQLEARGFALLRTQLPPALAHYLGATADDDAPPADIVAPWLAVALVAEDS